MAIDRMDTHSHRRELVWIAIVALILVGITVVQLFTTPRPLAPKLCGRCFAGLVPGRGTVFLQMNFSGDKVSGSGSLGADSIHLTGERDTSGNLQVRAIQWDGDGERTNGVFTGSIIPQPACFRGSWLPGGMTNPIRVELQQLADIMEVRRKAGLRIGRFGGTKEFTLIYPDFPSPLPFHRDINRRLRDHAVQAAKDFTGGALAHALDGVRWPGSHEWESENSIDVVYFSGELVSLKEFNYEFTGGAHGNGGDTGLNFISDGGQAREFQLADLFEPGGDWESCLSDVCIADLQRQQASSVTDGAIPKLNADEMGSFNVSPAGLQIHFSPYAVGSYAEGSFDVLVRWETLRSCLRTNGPTKLLTALNNSR